LTVVHEIEVVPDDAPAGTMTTSGFAVIRPEGVAAHAVVRTSIAADARMAVETKARIMATPPYEWRHVLHSPRLLNRDT
jgi:hypothetical protein